jgi:hypothetical protein
MAVRALPTRADRERYYCEFVAELSAFAPATQLRHVAGLLSSSFALRSALGGSSHPTGEVVMHSTTAGQRFRCRYLRWHHWTTASTPDGDRYVECAVCRKDHTGWDSAPRNAVAGISGSGGFA